MNPVGAISDGVGSIFNFLSTLNLGAGRQQDTIELGLLNPSANATTIANQRNKANQTVLLIMGGVILLLIIGLIRKK